MNIENNTQTTDKANDNQEQKIIIFKRKGVNITQDLTKCIQQLTVQHGYEVQADGVPLTIIRMMMPITQALLSFWGKHAELEQLPKTDQQIDKARKNLSHKVQQDKELIAKEFTNPTPVKEIEIADAQKFWRLRAAAQSKLKPFWFTEEYNYKRTDNLVYLPVAHFKAVQFLIDELVQEFGDQ